MDYESECKWINISCGAVIPGVLVILAESLWKIGSFRRSLTSGNFPKWVLTVSFLRGAAWHAAFTRMWKRASGSRARARASARTRGVARIRIRDHHMHTDVERGEKRGCAGSGVTYFPPFRLREFNALSVPRCRRPARKWLYHSWDAKRVRKSGKIPSN